jgi:hypothetical protein
MAERSPVKTTGRKTPDNRLTRAWYTCVRQARPFREVRRLPPELRLPRWFPVTSSPSSAPGS